MNSRTSFLQKALAPQTVRVSVHFEPGVSAATEQVDVLSFVKQQDVSRVIYAGDLRVEEIGRLVKSFTKLQGLSKLEVLQKLPTIVQKAAVRASAESSLRKYARDLLRLLTVLEVIDNDSYLTLDGEKLCRYMDTNRQKFIDYSAKLLLARAGWVAVVTEMNQLNRGFYYAASQKLLIDTVFENLKERKLVKKNDSWKTAAMIDCLVYMKILKPWDSVQKRYDVDLERLYDILARKTFT